MKKVYFAAKELEIRTYDTGDAKSDAFEEESQIYTFLKNNEENKYNNIFIFEEKEEGLGLERVIDLSMFYGK